MKNCLRLTIALSLLTCGGALAMLVETPDDVLDAGAELIATGRVISVASGWNADYTRIMTDVVFEVSGFDKGSAEARVVIRVPGGEVDDIGMLVEDTPVFEPGDVVTLRLEPTSEPSVFRLHGAANAVVGREGLDKKPEKPGGRKPPKLYSYSGFHREPASCYYEVNQGVAGWLDAIQASNATWDAAGSVFRFYYDGTTTATGPTYDGTNVVTAANLGSGGILAQNTYWYLRKGKLVLENDIVFNSYYDWSTSGEPSKYDVQNICTHEMGHCLVLNDMYTSLAAEQTMYGYAGLGETKKRTLEQGDKDGILRIYGAAADN
ncbi:MAG: matrixin family metalloprotease [candidate division WOR-3 bacterium]|nr:MAG: matrixin family metalloprotease [candidate division WOR-3 bacterium]